MSRTAPGQVWTPRNAALIGLPPLLAVGLAVMTSGVGMTAPPAFSIAAVLPVALIGLGLQIWHSIALAAGRRPRLAGWTMLVLVLVATLPLPWFGEGWLPLQGCVMASVPLVLSGWRARIAIATPPLLTAVALFVINGYPPSRSSIGYLAYVIFFYLAIMGAIAAGVYGGARLVRLAAELRETQGELAAAALRRERLRVSRDLHDLLGQSLSAVSLKGDLAIRLLTANPAAARAEMVSVAEVARDALRGVRAISRDEMPRSLRTEADTAVTLLSAAGIKTDISLDIDGLPVAVERTLSWALREGVANVVRHSQASQCSIRAGHRDGQIFIELVNDGASEPPGAGTGLAGIAERAEALSGSATWSRSDDGKFRLRVQLPERHT